MSKVFGGGYGEDVGGGVGGNLIGVMPKPSASIILLSRLCPKRHGPFFSFIPRTITCVPLHSAATGCWPLADSIDTPNP